MKRNLKTTKKNKSIILLSGGLDSLVSLGLAKEELNIELALTFDYGQRTAKKEIEASKRIAEHYSISHNVIKLDWLAQITDTALVNTNKDLPSPGASNLDNLELAEKSARGVWVPNRNGVFLNIAAAYADSMGFTHIIFGANKEEAATFPDNSEAFIEKINAAFEYSTLVKPIVVAPLAAYTKTETVKLAIKHNVPLNLLRSCYTDEEIHCGECESCLRLKRALTEVFGSELPVKFKA
ncbi:MAG: 7-cyano-7-deazaguanine synthase QueC [Candidatus Gastranaerophilales bacterium]|nr:7-cyano-7-deazaguanine synthase QueC [Candidatus Gastranaerophilales bacterium]